MNKPLKKARIDILAIKEINMDSNTTPKTTAKDVFLHIGVIVSLYVFAVSFLTFFFEIINYIFPDRQVFWSDPYSSSIRVALSTLIVSFPIFVYLLRKINLDLIKNKEKRNLAIRRWFIYLTIFVTALTTAIDLIVLINTFLGGEISTRFIWKVVVVAFVALSIFTYSLLDLRGLFFEKPKMQKIIMTATSFVVLASIVWGFVVIGSPTKFRNLRDDQQRISDLTDIQWQLLNKYQTVGSLPNSLSELQDNFSGYVVPVDPKTGESYLYKSPAILATTTLSFELCAKFGQDMPDTEGRGAYPVKDFYGAGGLENSNWEYTIGENCFKRTIDPVTYPVNPKMDKGL